MDNFVDNWKNADISAFDNFSHNFFQNIAELKSKFQTKFNKCNFAKKCVRYVQNYWFYARISVLNKSNFALLEGNKGFVVKKSKKLFGFTIYLSAKIWFIFRYP